ncbi:uncharacterized protein LOC142168793 [Nicotiana tabacum]|uniref:Uncharacterized protein LOC142168793 n=1 Tax=Nicotiana tabacum TaxID=4097 RepID=A0AC58SM61_TOBAC|nr:uncharacterized protein LOC104097967 [Nicotiana tomentosiformis]
MKIIASNVRGVNKVYKQKEVKKFITNNDVGLIAILNNRVKEENASRVINKITTNWRWCANYSHSSKGRIWIVWDPNSVEFEISGMSVQAIHGTISISQLQIKITMSAVYGMHTIETRKDIWEELRSVNNSVQGPWLAIRYFNAITDMDDRQFGNPVQENEIRDFNDFLQSSGMAELRIVGRRYTWPNGQICSRIDSALVNVEWLLTIVVTEVVILNPEISDHTPLSIQLKEAVKRSPKPFRFLNCLAEHKDFPSVVANVWCRPTGKNHMEDIWWKLKVLKTDLKQLNQREFRNVEENIELYRQKLHDIQTQMGSHNHPNVLFVEEKELKLELEK